MLKRHCLRLKRYDVIAYFDRAAENSQAKWGLGFRGPRSADRRRHHLKRPTDPVPLDLSCVHGRAAGGVGDRMLTRRPRIYHSGKTFQERLFAHRIAVEQGALIFGFSNHVFSSIRREFLALLKDTRESLDLDRRFRRIEKLRELDEAVDYLSEQKYREAVERQRRPEPKPTQSRTPAEPAFLRIVKPGAGLMIPPFCHTCLGTGTLYHTEKEPAGWVAFFEPCPLCRPNETAAFPGRLRQVSTGRGAAS